MLGMLKPALPGGVERGMRLGYSVLCLMGGALRQGKDTNFLICTNILLSLHFAVDSTSVGNLLIENGI